ADGRRDDERPRLLDGAMVARLQFGAAAWTVSDIVQRGGLRQQAARLARDEAGLGGGEFGGGHRVASRPAAGLPHSGGSRPSAHSMLCHASRLSIESPMAGNRMTSAPIAYMPMPASTVASSAILISETRIPRIITSFIAHGCMW